MAARRGDSAATLGGRLSLLHNRRRRRGARLPARAILLDGQPGSANIGLALSDRGSDAEYGTVAAPRHGDLNGPDAHATGWV